MDLDGILIMDYEGITITGMGSNSEVIHKLETNCDLKDDDRNLYKINFTLQTEIQEIYGNC